MTAPRSAEIHCDRVTKTFRSGARTLDAVSSLSLDIKPGTFLSLVGPSGCGKSTLLLMIAGLTGCSSGSISVGDEVVRAPRRDAGIVFQRDSLLEWRTVLDNVLLIPDLRGLRTSEYVGRARELLEQVGLLQYQHLYPSQLSGGMRQRVSIVRALVLEQPILLMDEPFAALDALTREQMILDLQALWWRTRPTVVFVTHDIGEAVFLSDQVAVMTPHPGRIQSVEDIGLARPRRLGIRQSAEFVAHERKIYEMFTRFGIIREPDYAPLAPAGAVR
ncbi:MAG: NitT/TauT family transport system ATP-binding protein [Chloroflexota bacterium]|nr:NitT/TauT family transport system ATP-binding protein [Chloroflexota bacterium]